MPADDVPVLVKHMAVAIYRSGWGTGGKEQRFYHSLVAARTRLVEYGHLRKGSQYGPPVNIKLTGKGRKANREHLHESDAGPKNKLFNMLYGLIEAGVEEEVGEASEDPASPDASKGNSQDAYKAYMQIRKAKAAAATPGPPRRKTAKAKKARTRRVRRRT